MQQQRAAIERENRVFCEKYGRLFGTREHTLCAEDLEDIRTNERQRTLDNLKISDAVLRPDPRRAEFPCGFSGSD